MLPVVASYAHVSCKTGTIELSTIFYIHNLNIVITKYMKVFSFDFNEFYVAEQLNPFRSNFIEIMLKNIF